MEHPNANLARRFLDALIAKDFATVEKLVAPDVVAHMPGAHALSGTHTGRDAVFGMFARAESLVDSFEREVHDIAAGDDHVVILVRITVMKNGAQITWNGANLWHVRDGALSEVWMLSEDQAVTDAAFS